jgi:hypothetical protein
VRDLGVVVLVTMGLALIVSFALFGRPWYNGAVGAWSVALGCDLAFDLRRSGR